MLNILIENIKKDTSLRALLIHDSVSAFSASNWISGTNLVVVMTF